MIGIEVSQRGQHVVFGLVGLAVRRLGHGCGARLAPGVAHPGEVDRPVDHDPMQPRCERPATIKTLERTYGGEKRFLRDVLGAVAVVTDKVGSSLGGDPMAVKQRCERRL